jgi:hypothetical protein
MLTMGIQRSPRSAQVELLALMFTGVVIAFGSLAMLRLKII